MRSPHTHSHAHMHARTHARTHTCTNTCIHTPGLLPPPKVLDARDPMGTRSSKIEQYLKEEKPHKHLILLLNKCDLVPTWVTVSCHGDNNTLKHQPAWLCGTLLGLGIVEFSIKLLSWHIFVRTSEHAALDWGVLSPLQCGSVQLCFMCCYCIL